MKERIGGSTTCTKCGHTRPAEFIECPCETRARIKRECKKYDDFIPKKFLDHLKKKMKKEAHDGNKE